jgi:hypothetical protein
MKRPPAQKPEPSELIPEDDVLRRMLAAPPRHKVAAKRAKKARLPKKVD